ncbi:uncharacterized protein LOC110025175 [Phalaenopsis equestris]|uniref:uncharacterized protein LOC110025175 n=1 Tax=Phalaenopsis equestris TaxID=78828 RepID=UPI0009E5041D|nr:uncharacterized protein LOC110025175 [Phalaenopsis equestris]
MAIGKITIVIGAGLLGSVLSKEGGLSDATNFFSGALRIVTKHLQQDKDGSGSAPKPKTDTLLAQVNNLRKELQILASSRSVTIVTSTRAGSRAYGVTALLVVGCLGCGYAWWKGWKFSDMMFATRRGFSDACSNMGKQFEFVSSSITSAKRHLSSKIDVVDHSLDEMKELNAATKNEVMLLHGDAGLVHMDVDSITRAVRNLESKMDQIDDGQNFAGRGLYALCKFAEGWQLGMNNESISDSSFSSVRAIKQSQTLGVSRTGSLPPLALESPSTSCSTETPKVLRPSITLSAGGLKELQQVSNPIHLGNSRTSPGNASKAANSASGNNRGGGTSTPVRSVWKLPGINALTRSWSNNA